MTTILRAAECGWTYATTSDMVIEDCPTCGITHGIPSDYRARRKADGSTWYCPNGHPIVFTKSDAAREREKREAAERRASAAEDTARRWRENAEAERRSAAAYKGHLTRARNRIANGVCPVPGCKRSGFTKVAAHIASAHPEWAHEHPDVLA